MIAYIGLIIITIGWVSQIKSISKKKKEISRVFVGGYIVGVVLLIIDGLTNQLTTLAMLNSLTLLAAAGVWWKLR